MKRWIRVSIFLVAIGCLVIVAVIADVQLKYAGRILSMDFSSWPEKDGVATVVLGAGITENGQPSSALKDRMDTALSMQKAGVAGTLFATGDDGKYHEDEIDVMVPYLLQHGASTSTLIIDPTGYRTYESCKHAKEAGITNAILVTQRFHLARALYICNKLGVDSYGVDADIENYGTRIYYDWGRDLLASAKAWWDINVVPPKPPVS